MSDEDKLPYVAKAASRVVTSVTGPQARDLAAQASRIFAEMVFVANPTDGFARIT